MPLPQFIKGSGKGSGKSSGKGFEKGYGKGFEKGKGKGYEKGTGKGKGDGKVNEFRTFSALGFDPSYFELKDENISYNHKNNTLYTKLTHTDTSIKGVSIKVPSLVCENPLQFVKNYNGQINVKTNGTKYNSNCYLQLRVTPYFINQKDTETVSNINFINKNINTFNKFHDNVQKWLKKELSNLMKKVNKHKFEKKDDDPDCENDVLKLSKKDMDELKYISPTFSIKAYSKNNEEYSLDFFKPSFVYEEDISSTNSNDYDGTGKFNVFFKKNKEKFESTTSTFNPMLEENNLKGFMVSSTIQIQGIWVNLTNKTYGLKIKTKTFEVEPKLHPKYNSQTTHVASNSNESNTEGADNESEENKFDFHQTIPDELNETSVEIEDDDW
jgi:hypothetical protein